jgi:YD repeat-containing protein
MKLSLFILTLFIFFGCTVGEVDPNTNLKGKIKSIKYSSSFDPSTFYIDNFEYNSTGFVSKSIRLDQNNKLTDELTLTRNADNLVTSSSFGPPDGIKFTRTFKYDASKKLTSEDNRNNTITYEYGADGSLTKTKIVNKSSQNITEANYKWTNENLSTITYPTVGIATYTKYDDKANPFYQLYIKDIGIWNIFVYPEYWSKNNLISRKSSNGNIQNYVYEYDTEGNVIKLKESSSSGIIVTFTYY